MSRERLSVLDRTRRRATRVVVGVLATRCFSAPAAAHGASSTGGDVLVTLPAVVAGSVGVSVAGGGLAVRVFGDHRFRTVVSLLFLLLGGLAVGLALDGNVIGVGLGGLAAAGWLALAARRSRTGHGSHDDVALGAVTLHRGLEGVVLATVYAADAALGLLGAGVLTAHAAAETAAVGSLYGTDRYVAFGAVAFVQLGFVLGVGAGWFAIDAVPPIARSGVLALVGICLFVVGARETSHHLGTWRPVTE
jgi:hypothetical protein